MILIAVPLLMVLIGLALGGRLDHLHALPLRWGALALVAFGVQWLLVRVSGADPLLGAAFVASYGLLIVFLLANRRVPGLRLVLVGTLLNLAVLLANGGFMPIAPATLHTAFPDRPPAVSGERPWQSKDIVLAPDQARLPGLGDAVVLIWPFRAVFSIGDLILAAGVGMLVLRGMQPRWGLRRRKQAVRALARTHVPGP